MFAGRQRLEALDAAPSPPLKCGPGRRAQCKVALTLTAGEIHFMRFLLIHSAVTFLLHSTHR